MLRRISIRAPKFRRPERRTLIKASSALVVGAVIAASAVVPAQAATGDISAGEGVLLSGGGIVNVDNIAALGGAYSSTNTSSSAGTVSNPLNLAAVNALGVNLGNGVQLLGTNGLLTLGVSGQYANSTSTGAVASSGLIGSDGSIAVSPGQTGGSSTLNLTPLLSSSVTSSLASAAQLNIGALASRIQETRGSTVSSSATYGIAGANFTVTSPAVAGLNTSLQTTVNGIGSSLNNALSNTTALNGVVSGTTGQLTTALNTLIPGLLSLNGTSLTASISGLNLNAVTAPVLAQTYTSGAVSVVPSTGSITIDLNAIQALNNQNPNTQLLSTATLQDVITTALQNILVTQLPAALNTAVVSAIGSATINATLKANVAVAGINATSLNVAISTSLGNLLKTTGRAPLTITATGTAIAGLTPITLSSAILNPVLQPVIDTTFAPLLAGLLTPTVNAIPATLAAVTTPVSTILGGLAPLLDQLVSITVNAQDSSTGFRDSRGTDAGAKSVHALQLSILPLANALVVNLATSTVNATATAPIAITAPTAGQQFTVATSTATRTITVTGTGEPSATVNVDLGGGRTGQTTVAADGTWSTPIAGVGVGAVTASATQTFGGVVSAAVTQNFTVVAQQPLTITTPTAGKVFTVVSSSATTPVTISGTATPGATVALDLGAGGTGTATAGSDGNWTTSVTGVPVGSFTISATQTSGGVTSAAVTRAFSVAAGSPLTVTAPTDGTRIVVPGATSTTTVTVTGTAQPGATVAASLGGTLTGSVTAAADGSYSIPVAGVGTGSYTVSVTQTVAGTQSAAITRNLTVASASPLVINSPVVNGTFTVASPTSTTPVTVSGTAQAGSTVTVQLATGIQASTQADVTGAWSIPFSGVPVANYTISATQTVAGVTSAAVTRPFSVVAGAPVVIQTPTTNTTVADPTSTTPVTVTGTAAPGASVAVSLGAGLSSIVSATGAGSWSASFPTVPVGDYTISAAQTIGGTTSTAVTRAYSVIAGAPVVIQTPDPSVPVIVAGPGKTATLTVTGTAAPSASVLVDLGDGLSSTVTAAADGSWTAPFTGVPIGTSTISVTQTIGGTTSPAVTQSLTVKAGAPVVVVTPASGSSVTVFGATGTTGVVVTGTGQPGAVITTSLGTGHTGTTTVTPLGTWAVTLPTVPVGTYTLTTSQAIAGSTSTPVTQPFSVVVGGAIVITAPATGRAYVVADSTSTRTTAVSGIATPGSTVDVTLTGGATRSTTASPTDGTWSVSFANLPVGAYAVNATQTLGVLVEAAVPTAFSIVAGSPLVISSPVSGTAFTVASSTSVTPVPISGWAQPGATVTVSLGAAGTLTTTAAADGSWTVTADGTSNGTGNGLGVGSYSVSATQTVNATTSAAVTTAFTVAAGTTFGVSAPIDNATLLVADGSGTQTVPVSGVGQVGGTVAVTLGGTTKTVPVDLNGTWQTSFANVGTGTYAISSVETVGGTTAGPVVTHLTVAAAPALTIGAPADASTITLAGPTSTTDVTVSGAAAPGSTVVVTVGGITKTVTDTAGGTWTATYPALPVAAYTVSATQALNGTVSAPVTSTFRISAGTPVVISTPTVGTRITVADDDQTTAVPVSGTAQPGAAIHVSLGSGLTADTMANATTGAWSTSVPAVPTGAYTVSVTQTVGGTTSIAVVSTVAVVPAAPVVITAPAAGLAIHVADATGKTDVTVAGTAQPGATVHLSLNGGASVDVTADNSGSWSTTLAALAVDGYTLSATQTVGATTSGAVTSAFSVTVGTGITVTTPTPDENYVVPTVTSTTDVKVSGSAEPGAMITVQTDGGIAATATAKLDGTWTATLANVPAGDHEIAVAQTVNGSITATPTKVTIHVAPAAALTIATPAAGDDVVVTTAAGTVGLPVSGHAQPDSLISIDLGGGLTATTTSGDDGTWSTTVPNVPVGTYTVSVTQTIGTTVSAPVTRPVTVRAAAPVVIQTPAAAASLKVALPSSTVGTTVTGTAEPDVDVRVALDGGTAVVVHSAADGKWSLPLTGLAVGSHTVRAAQVVADGTTVPVSVTFSVDVAADLTITSPQPAQSYQVAAGDTTDVTVTGTGLAGASVAVTLDGARGRTVTVADNGTWTTTFTAVGPTGHVAEATQSIGGTAQDPQDVAFSVDEVTAPAAPVTITTPAPDTTIPDANGDGKVDVTVTGTGEPGSTITVDLGDGHTGTTTVGDDGTWTVVVPDVPVGPYTVVVTQSTDGTVTGSGSVPIDSVTVAPATITEPSGNAPITVSGPGATADVPVSGTGEPGATIVVSLGGGLTATTTVGDDGTWTTTVTDVPVGPHTVTVTETADGATLPPVTQPVAVAVADPVVIVTPSDNGVVTTASPNGTTTLVVTGTAQAGSIVTVALDGGTPKTVNAGTDGTWSVGFTGVGVGTHEVTATQTLADGTTPAVSTEVTVRAANKAIITSPQAGQQFQVAPGGTQTVQVTGSGEPGASVAVSLDGAGATRVTVNGTGGWTAVFGPVAIGNHTISATQTVGTTVQDPTSVTFTVAATSSPAVAPTITSPTTGQSIRDDDGDGTFDVPVTGTGQPGSSILVDLGDGITRTVTVGTNGTWSTTVGSVPDGTRTITVTQTTGTTVTGSTSVQVVGTKAAPIVITSPTAAQLIANGLAGSVNVPVTGTAEPGATVKVRLDSGTVLTTTADESGAWTVTLPSVAAGDHVVSATETVGAAVSAPTSVAFTVSTKPDGGTIWVSSPRDGALIVDFGADGSENVTVTGGGTPGALITVVLDDGTTMTTTVGSNGKWSLRFVRVPTGPHSYVASQTADGVTTQAPEQTFTISEAAPVVVASPLPGSVMTAGADGTALVTIDGTAQPNATVTVTLDDGTTQTVTADAQGHWSLRFAKVAVGNHTYTVRQTIDGFTSDPAAFAFSVRRAVVINPGGGTNPGDPGTGTNPGTGNNGNNGSGSGSVQPAGNGGSSTPTSVGEQVLAFTGSTVLPWAVVGAGILALGLGMLGASRGLSRIRARKR